MSINKIYLPEVELLKSFLQEHGKEKFFNRFIRKREAFIGSSESFKFIEEFAEDWIRLDDTVH